MKKSLVLFILILTSLTLGLWAQGSKSGMEKNVRVELEQCLNTGCDQATPILIPEALKLETILWNKQKKEGMIVIRERYNEPNLINYGDLVFDHIAFSPTRKMAMLYEVDRLTFWPKNKSKYVKLSETGIYKVKVPRRSTTLLLEVTGLETHRLQGKIKAVRDIPVLSLVLGFFGHEGEYVRWNNKDYIAFSDMEKGASYELVLGISGVKFSKTGSDSLGDVIWKDHYQPVKVELK